MESCTSLEIGEIYHSNITAGFEEIIEFRTDLILPRLAVLETKAAAECLARYGDLVWSLARKQKRAAHETEAAVCEIFQDIWESAHLFDAGKHDERTFVALIALRRLFKKNPAADGLAENF